MNTNFPLGRISITFPALAALEEAHVHPMLLVARHQGGDWGAACPDDNLSAIAARRDQVLGGYSLRGSDVEVWVITDLDAGTTTIMLAEEY